MILNVIPEIIKYNAHNTTTRKRSYKYHSKALSLHSTPREIFLSNYNLNNLGMLSFVMHTFPSKYYALGSTMIVTIVKSLQALFSR